MQTPKTRSGSSEVPRKTSPSTPKSSRLTRPAALVSESSTSPSLSSKNPTDGSPRVIQRRSPRSPVLEKKRPSKVMELESQVTQLQEDLKKAKDQLSSSESRKNRAQKEAEEAIKQVADISAKAEDSQRRLVELSSAEESRLEELRKISQERDQAWQSELESIQKQHSVDSEALVSATKELQSLKLQLEAVVESEAAQAEQSRVAQLELHALKLDMAEKHSTIEDLKFQLKDTEKQSAEAQEKLHEIKKELDIAKTVEKTLRSNEMMLIESLNSTTSELEESRASIRSLQEIMKSLPANQPNVNDSEDDSRRHPHKSNNCSLDSDVDQMRCAMEASEIKHWEEQIISTFQIQSAYEFVGCLRTLSELREVEQDSVLKFAREEIDELKANVANNEAEFQKLSQINKELNTEVERNRVKQIEFELGLAEQKLELLNKETALQRVTEENEMLKLEMERRDAESHKNYEAAIAELELARSAEQEALMRLGYVNEEAEKSGRRAAKLGEQLDAVLAANSEMEAELIRLRVHADQWRKAAEAAAAILTTGNNDRLVERTGSLDSEYYSVRKLMSSPYSDDLCDESPKKKNNNVLRRIGGLWRKNQK